MSTSQQVVNTVPAEVLTESDIWHIFETEMAARQTAVAEYDQLGQPTTA